MKIRKTEYTSGGFFRGREHLAAPDGPCCYCGDYAGEALSTAVRIRMDPCRSMFRVTYPGMHSTTRQG